MNKLIGRENELNILNREYKKAESSLFLLYGRKRTGKTSLLREFGKDKDMIYFLATEEPESENRANFRKIVAENLRDDFLASSSVESWEIIFKSIVNSKRKKIVVMDEFQYLNKINPSFLATFKRIWDEILKNENIMVILSGSQMSMIETQVIHKNSFLSGRVTEKIKLEDIGFSEYKEFFGRRNIEKDLIEKYAITGGKPMYIETFSDRQDIYTGIKENIISKQGNLHDEPLLLLQSELGELGSYFSIMKSIAAGNRKLGNIASNLSVTPTNLSKYLQTLMILDVLEREVPITETNPEKSKKGRYKIKDNFMAFWFRFIYPNKPLLEMGKDNQVLNTIKDSFTKTCVSDAYENICRERMWNLNEEGKLGVRLNKIGRWWNNKEEIGIVGINSNGNDIVFGSAKYYMRRPVDTGDFYELVEKAKCVEWKSKNRREKYIMFTTTGYSTDLKRIAETRNDLILM